RLRLLRNLAFTKPRFWHKFAGFNFRMTGLQAALGRAQLRKIEAIIADKRRVAAAYGGALRGVPGLPLPIEADGACNVYWMYAVVVQPEFRLSRDQLIASLAAEGIETRTFFCPMNQQPCLQARAGYRPIACPVADRVWETGLYLPSSYNLAQST